MHSVTFAANMIASTYPSFTGMMFVSRFVVSVVADHILGVQRSCFINDSQNSDAAC